MTRKMVGISDEEHKGKHYTLSATGRASLLNATKIKMKEATNQNNSIDLEEDIEEDKEEDVEEDTENRTIVSMGTPSRTESVTVLLSIREKEEIIENVTSIKQGTKDKIKQLIQGKKNAFFYENEKSSIEEVLRAIGLAAGVGLGARSGFGPDLAPKFGDNFEVDH